MCVVYKQLYIKYLIIIAPLLSIKFLMNRALKFYLCCIGYNILEVIETWDKQISKYIYFTVSNRVYSKK